MNDFSPVVLLTGSAGGGKSHIAAEKIHLFCEMYPDSDAVVARKLEKDVKKSCWRMIKEAAKNSGAKFSTADSVAEYPNGSVIYFVGMRGESEQENIRSIGRGKVDIAWMEEAHEFEEDDYEEISGRMRGKAGGFSQIILSTNPSHSLHWIYIRLMLDSEASVHTSTAHDNPHNPQSYLDFLDRLTGVKRARLRDGKWVQATGMVISTWEDNWGRRSVIGEAGGNVTPEADFIPNGGPVWLLADDGYVGKYIEKHRRFTQASHPRVFLLAQKRSDDQLAVFAESYKVRVRKDNHINIMKRLCKQHGWPWPNYAVHDSASPSLGTALRQAGIRSVYPGTKNLSDSIDVFRDAVGPDENDWRQIIVHPRCRLVRLEMTAWAYDKKGNPSKYFDNGPDTIRYGIYHMHDPKTGDADVGLDEEQEELLAPMMDRIDRIYDQYMGELRL